LGCGGLADHRPAGQGQANCTHTDAQGIGKYHGVSPVISQNFKPMPDRIGKNQSNSLSLANPLRSRKPDNQMVLSGPSEFLQSGMEKSVYSIRLAGIFSPISKQTKIN
jgi:hypothetical protein